MQDFKPSRSMRTKGDRSIISSLKATRLIESKSILPAELISAILDYLSIPDLMNFAQTSKRMLEMVYEDSKWVQRLKVMDIWNEEEARNRNEKFLINREEYRDFRSKEANMSEMEANGEEFFGSQSEMEQKSVSSSMYTQYTSPYKLQNLTGSNNTPELSPYVINLNSDPQSHLNVLSQVRSVRGAARLEFAKIYTALAPYYNELTRSEAYAELAVFRVFPNPEQQAQILASLHKFSKCDWALGWKKREERLLEVIHLFESALLHQFKQGYLARDIDGKMRRYAHVMTVLTGGQTVIDFFVQHNSMFVDRKHFLATSMDCINQAPAESIALEPFKEFLTQMAQILNEQSEIIDRVFPQEIEVFEIFLEKFVEEILAEYVIPLLDEVHRRSIASFAKAVSGLFEQSMKFFLSLNTPQNSNQDYSDKFKKAMAKIFEPVLNLYLKEELDYFKKTADTEVKRWESQLSAREATTESIFMAHYNRQSDKRDFLTSFRKVVMMPIHILPSVPKFGTKQRVAQHSLNSSLRISMSPATYGPQSLGLKQYTPPVSPINTGPNDELNAKTVLMASRLEGIRSLISIEVTLNLIHAAKTSIERAALFILLSDGVEEKVREQCSLIFTMLIQILGQCHVKSGFDKAIDHLSKYTPRETVAHQQAVAPLVTFLELVNIGDLINQMLDVFYEQQLCAYKLIDRTDNFHPACKAKKNFEQMLDDRVASGLNKSIDVLMNEIEYICATGQLQTDYNPEPTTDGICEVAPSKTAELVVTLVETHTKMLEGSTDKNMLDVFNQEVGLRLFSVLCRHLKRQRISTVGAMRLISDMNLYFCYIKTLQNKELLDYFQALKALSQVYLIAPIHAKEIAEVIADTRRFGGLFRAEDIYEFVERRADWYVVKKNVEKAMYGIGCEIM